MTSPTTETQTARRVKYGANVAIAAIAAIAIVVGLNYIAYKRLFNVRFDLTSTRAWSLSDRTARVVDSLNEDYRLVMLISSANEYHQRALDFINEYDYLSDKLTVEHIDPKEQAKVDRFLTDMAARYDQPLKPTRDAQAQAMGAAEKVHEQLADVIGRMHAMLDNEQIADQGLADLIGEQANMFITIRSNFEQVLDELKKVRDEALPPLNDINTQLQRVFAGNAQVNINGAYEWFKAESARDDTPEALRESFGAMAELLGEMRGEMQAAAAAIKDITVPQAYEKMRNELRSQYEKVVIIGPEDKAPRVVLLNEMFRQGSQQEEAQTDLTFIGESKITGALVTMELDHDPMIVFVSTGQNQALGQQGDYQQLASRLRLMNFDVRQWRASPTTQQTMMGQPQMMPAEEPPVPAPGQSVVWVVPPIESSNPQMAMMGMSQEAQTVIAHLNQRIAQGDGVLMMLGVNRAAMQGMPDPAGDFVRQFGITPQLDRIILRERADPNRRRTGFVRVHQFNDWSDDSPITHAIKGLSAVFFVASPMTLSTEPPDGVSLKPLVQLTGEGLWAETDLSFLQTGEAELDADTASKSFTLAATVEKGGSRIMVVTDPAWATDYVTTNADPSLRLPQLGAVYGVAYPGNAELFINSTLWLLDLDQLIAPSGTQEIRRVDDISDKNLITLRWVLLAGMPLLALAAGIGVWFVRRKG
jgi:hypothetical protein